jgi:hypothetical protein
MPSPTCHLPTLSENGPAQPAVWSPPGHGISVPVVDLEDPLTYAFLPVSMKMQPLFCYTFTRTRARHMPFTVAEHLESPRQVPIHTHEMA